MKNVDNKEAEPKNFNFLLSKSENEFFDEERNKFSDVWRIKRFEEKNQSGWNVFKNQDLWFEIKEYRLSKKEKEFLLHKDGICFLLKNIKNGLNSIPALKSLLAKQLKGE